MLFPINTKCKKRLRKTMVVTVSTASIPAGMFFFWLLGIMFLVCSCDHSYNEKLKGTWDGIEAMRKQNSPYVRWRIEKSAGFLETESKKTIKQGVIVFAHYGHSQTSNPQLYKTGE